MNKKDRGSIKNAPRAPVVCFAPSSLNCSICNFILQPFIHHAKFKDKGNADRKSLLIFPNSPSKNIVMCMSLLQKDLMKLIKCLIGLKTPLYLWWRWSKKEEDERLADRKSWLSTPNFPLFLQKVLKCNQLILNLIKTPMISVMGERRGTIHSFL